DHLGAREPVFKLSDAPLVERLLLLGGVILGVLREIAVRARVGYLLDDAGPLDLLALLELALEHGVPRRRHRNLVHSSFWPPKPCLGQKFGSRAECLRPHDRENCPKLHRLRPTTGNPPGVSLCRRNSSAARGPRGRPRDRP